MENKEDFETTTQEDVLECCWTPTFPLPLPGPASLLFLAPGTTMSSDSAALQRGLGLQPSQRNFFQTGTLKTEG